MTVEIFHPKAPAIFYFITCLLSCFNLCNNYVKAFIASFLVNTNCAREDGEWDHIFEMVIANEIARMIYRLTNEIIILTGG